MKLFRVQKMLTAYVLAETLADAKDGAEDALRCEVGGEALDRPDVVEVQPGEQPQGGWLGGHNVYHDECRTKAITLREALDVLVMGGKL